MVQPTRLCSARADGREPFHVFRFSQERNFLVAPKNHSANSKTATILDRALYNERPDTRQELPFKSPKRERIERLVLADSCLSHCNIFVLCGAPAQKAATGKNRPIADGRCKHR